MKRNVSCDLCLLHREAAEGGAWGASNGGISPSVINTVTGHFFISMSGLFLNVSECMGQVTSDNLMSAYGY